jgi:plastocyanin
MRRDGSGAIHSPSKSGASARRVLELSGILFALAFVAGCASTSSIEGRIRIPSERGLAKASVRTPGTGGARDTMDAVVMAWPQDGSRGSHGEARASIVQAGGRFVPRVLVVEPGTIVEFENHDHIYHNAFCVSTPRPFDLGRYAPGQTREMKFEETGIYHIFCELHERELAFVVVAPDRWHTRPGPDGRFVLDDVPPGTYLVRAWHPLIGNRTRKVEVSKKEPAQIDFGL